MRAPNRRGLDGRINGVLRRDDCFQAPSAAASPDLVAAARQGVSLISIASRRITALRVRA